MEVVDRFYDGDGEFSLDMEPWGKGPDQGKIKHHGLPYLREEYPKLTYIVTCKVVGDEDISKIRQVEEKEKKWRKWGRRDDDDLGDEKEKERREDVDEKGKKRKSLFDREDFQEKLESRLRARRAEKGSVSPYR